RVAFHDDQIIRYQRPGVQFSILPACTALPANKPFERLYRL
ncbi:hypothetical protein A679_04422, partial [Salmonella enterica subsp. enterica serovar Enteritidis str. 2010K-0284]